MSTTNRIVDESIRLNLIVARGVGERVVRTFSYRNVTRRTDVIYFLRHRIPILRYTQARLNYYRGYFHTVADPPESFVLCQLQNCQMVRLNFTRKRNLLSILKNNNNARKKRNDEENSLRGIKWNNLYRAG